MAGSGKWIGSLLGVVLCLPAMGTTTRDRDFCGRWLKLTTPEKHEVLRAAEASEAGPEWDAECRTNLRGSLRHTLDSECRNWKLLMDFEVRALIDRVLKRCCVADS